MAEELFEYYADLGIRIRYRSEEHTSELQSHSEISYAVFCLKKKKSARRYTRYIQMVATRYRPRSLSLTAPACGCPTLNMPSPLSTRPVFFLLIRGRPRSTPYPTLFPYTTLFR